MLATELKKPKTVEEVLHVAWDGIIPVDPKQVAYSLDMAVRELDPLGADSILSGKFEYDDGTPVCYYNSSEAPVRQRFTIAHEIGHYVLGHGRAMRDPATNFTLGKLDYREVQANQFAASLLMPKNVVKNMVRHKGIDDVEELADRFFVSQVAMKYRLKNLGLIV